MATGVGGPAGLMLISAGADTIIQKATTGEVNWGQVAVSGAAGAVGFGVGGALAKTAMSTGAKHVVANVAEGAVSSGAGYLTGPGPHTVAGLAENTGFGAATGGVPIRGAAGHATSIPAAGRSLDRVVPSPLEAANSGSGPVAGVLEASSQSKSVAALKNYNPKGGGVEYVFDPESSVFATGRPAQHVGLKGSPHEQLAQSIGANPDTVVGGTLSRGPAGEFLTTEQSGHYWQQNWNDDVRTQFSSTMKGHGVDFR